MRNSIWFMFYRSQPFSIKRFVSCRNEFISNIKWYYFLILAHMFMDRFDFVFLLWNVTMIKFKAATVIFYFNFKKTLCFLMKLPADLSVALHRVTAKLTGGLSCEIIHCFTCKYLLQVNFSYGLPLEIMWF